jgi:hypothetical protein
MTRVLTDNTLSRHLVQAGQVRAACFSWPDMAKKLLNLYEKIIEG